MKLEDVIHFPVLLVEKLIDNIVDFSPMFDYPRCYWNSFCNKK